MSSTGLAISGAFLAVLIGASSTPVHGQEIGDRREGLALAQQVCSECHVIGRGQVGPPNSRAPTFSELATAPGMTVGALTVALTTPHVGMPMFMFTADQRRDAIAYIPSLR